MAIKVSKVFTARWGAEKGDKGDGGLSVQLSPSLMSFPADEDGVATGNYSFACDASLLSGGEKQIITDYEVTPSDKSGIMYAASLSSDKKTLNVSGKLVVKKFANDNPWLDITLTCAQGVMSARFNMMLSRRGADGTSVMAQYSTDGTSWHTTYTAGDLYMRTSTDGGKTWSEAMRVVGEKGEGGAWTDYSYNTSSLLTTSNVYTAPSDIAAWYDAPIATTSGKPYLWMRVQKYVDTDTKDGAPTYLRITGEKGADGTSVNIKGYVSGWVGDVGQVITNDESLPWAVDDPHCIYIASTGEEREVKDGEGYLIKAYELDGETDNEGHLIVSSDGKWLDCGKITGEAGADGKTMYLHIAYANSADGSKDFTTDDDGGKTRSYMGTYTDFIQADSTNYKNYYWKPYKGEKGDDGESALYIVATPETDTYPADTTGAALKYTTHSVELTLYYGETAVEDYDVEVCSVDDANWYTAETLKDMAGDVYVSSIEKSGAVCTVWYQVGEANYKDDNAYIQVRMTSAKYGQRVKRVNCFAQKKGDKGDPGDNGTNGLIVRRSEWEAGKEYRNDTDRGSAAADGNYYLDEVCVSSYNGGNGKYYICKETHKSTASNKPKENASTDEWTPLTSTEPIKTPFADITTAFVEYLQSRQINIVDDNNVPYGAFGGGDYPLWFGGKNAEKAVFKVSKEGRAQMSTYGYSISNAPAIDDYPTCLGVPVWLWAHDSENEQSAAVQYLTMESSIYTISPGIDFSNKGDGYTPDNLIWCIPLAKDIGKFCLEIYIKLPSAFASKDGAPRLFICQGTLTDTPSGTLDGVYTSKNYDCFVEVHSSSDGSSPAAYKIYDDALTENMIWKKYFPTESSYQLGLEYGYMELKLWEDTSTVNRFKYLPRYVRLLSDGKNWHLVDYRYS